MKEWPGPGRSASEQQDHCSSYTTSVDSTGDRRVDAALAALGEHLSRRDGWPTPRWVTDPQLEAVPWWFVTALKGLHPRALVESPLSFRKRGVFITNGALQRA